MVSQNVNKLLQQAESLTLEERQQFVELLKCQPTHEHSKSQGQEMTAALAEKGIILTVPPQPTPEDIARFKAWKPIKMPGGPLSDDIIRDRR